MLTYEIFINFKAVFEKDFKVNDQNYPTLETEESDDGDKSEIIN